MRTRSTNKSLSIASLEYHRGTQIRCGLFSILWPGGAEHQHLSLVPGGFRAISATPPIRQTRQAGILFESMIWRINESLNQGFSESVRARSVLHCHGVWGLRQGPWTRADGRKKQGLKLVSRQFRKRRLAVWAAGRGPDPSFTAMVFEACDRVLGPELTAGKSKVWS